MSTTAVAGSFLNQVALKVREVSNIDLFHNNPSQGSNKLVLDYEIPISGPSLKPTIKFVVKLGARIQYPSDGVIKKTFIYASTTYQPQYWLAGPMAWEGFADMISSGLVSGMRVHLSQHFPDCRFITIKAGDVENLEPLLGRIYIP